MPDARFLQIHSLHGYSAVLLNRDDSGLAKRINYGGAIRTRISSQCLKRHWRVADSDYALQRIDGATASVRSRETVTRRVIQPLEGAGHHADAIKVISGAFQTAVYGDKGDKRSNRQPCCSVSPRSPISPTKRGRLRGTMEPTRKRPRPRRRSGSRTRRRT